MALGQRRIEILSAPACEGTPTPPFPGLSWMTAFYEVILGKHIEIRCQLEIFALASVGSGIARV